MRKETRESMENLFTAKWNVPKAAKHCGLSVKEVKIVFSEYMIYHDVTYIEENNTQLHLF
jgi:hypothetical protein